MVQETGVKGKVLCSPLHLNVGGIEKGTFESPTNTVGQITDYKHICIYIYISK